MIEPFAKRLLLQLAYLPNYGMVRLRLSATGFEKDSIEKEIDAFCNPSNTGAGIPDNQ